MWRGSSFGRGLFRRAGRLAMLVVTTLVGLCLLSASALGASASISFAPAKTYSCSGCSRLTKVAVADFNHDGKPDVVAVGGTSEVDVFTNYGNGGFSGPTP